MASRDEIISFCDELLDVSAWPDYGPNGLQVPGSAEVTKVVTGVSAHLELLERAVAAGAQLVIVHHGLFWDFHPRSLSEPMAARLRLALGSNLSVAGYHLPLDAHREIGNNALIASALELNLENGDLGMAKGRAVGVVARAPRPLGAEELVTRLGALTGREPLVQGAGPSSVVRVGIVSGAAASSLGDAIAQGLDAFITGEPAEHAMAEASEGAIHFIAAGHYATETFGVRRLGDLVAAHFRIEHEFIEVPNPV